MAHPHLLRCAVVFSSGALVALALPSCSSSSVAGDSAAGAASTAAAGAGIGLGSAGALTAGTAGSTGFAGSATGAGAGAPGSSGASSMGGMTSSAGGAPAAGGGSASAACTDKPPNNGDTCAHAVEYNWCAESWLADSCQASCKKCTAGTGSGAGGTSSGSAGAASSAGGATGSAGSSSGGPTLPPVTGGKDGWASRYWDCCKPACGWSSATCGKDGTSSDGGNSACSGGSAYQCYDFAPWAVSDTLSYGFVAAAGSNYSCGKCFQFTFNGQGAAKSSSLNGKSMVVQVVNTGGDVAESQFDLLLPGGGVGQFNACSNQWNASTSDLGAQYGGFATTCANDPTCIKNKCTTIFAGKPDLLAGCNWFLGWYGGADNPKFSYKEIACPAAITAKSGH